MPHQGQGCGPTFIVRLRTCCWKHSARAMAARETPHLIWQKMATLGPQEGRNHSDPPALDAEGSRGTARPATECTR